MRSLRILSPLALVCLLALGAFALGGCGSVRRPLALMREPVASPSVRAAAYARAVNLKQADLPYFEAQEEEQSARDRRRERIRGREFERCVGAEDEGDRTLAEASSPDFTATSPPGYLSIQSSVAVAPSSRGAARAVRLMRSSRVENCMRQVYVPGLEELEPDGVEIRHVSFSRLRPPLPGVKLSFGFRMDAITVVSSPTAQLSAYRPAVEAPRTVTLPMHIDLFSFIVGPASIELTATAMPTPAARVLERNLLRRLHSRAVALAP